MTATATEVVTKLTDEAIKKRIAAIDRLVEHREGKRAELAGEIGDLQAERAGLVKTQIERLQAQLPKATETA